MRITIIIIIITELHKIQPCTLFLPVSVDFVILL